MTRMWHSGAALLALLRALHHGVAAQHSGWVKDQVNATLCLWEQPRAAVLNDTLYIDGGRSWWTPGLASGSYGIPVPDRNPRGVMYSLNFSTPFTISQNITNVLGTVPREPHASSTSIVPNYYDGALLANHHQLFLFGGLISNDALSPPASEIPVYRASTSSPDRPVKPGFATHTLPAGMSRYITYGGFASAPSENKAWFFGGMRGENGEEISMPHEGVANNPKVHSNVLLRLDMGTQFEEKWSNSSLPAHIRGRANAEVVWVPVGAQGILVVLGGVLYPEYAQFNHVPADLSENLATGSSFMSTVDIYDIAGDRWYKQGTYGGPTARTRGCAVVASARDGSSHNIYWHGGYDGVNTASEYDDDVWVLSLPTFSWIKLATGKVGQGRAGHRCVMPFPDTMLVVGGAVSQMPDGSPRKCLPDGLVRLVNLTSGERMTSYSPKAHQEYGVPEVVRQRIGGDWAGGATAHMPVPTGWSDPNLGAVFATAYPTHKIKKFYPYDRPTSMPVVPSPTATPRPTNPGNGGLPLWARSLLIVVACLLGASILALVCCLWSRRRRRQRQKHATSRPKHGTPWIHNHAHAHANMNSPTKKSGPIVATASEKLVARATHHERYPHPQARQTAVVGSPTPNTWSTPNTSPRQGHRGVGGTAAATAVGAATVGAAKWDDSGIGVASSQTSVQLPIMGQQNRSSDNHIGNIQSSSATLTGRTGVLERDSVGSSTSNQSSEFMTPMGTPSNEVAAAAVLRMFHQHQEQQLQQQAHQLQSTMTQAGVPSLRRQPAFSQAAVDHHGLDDPLTSLSTSVTTLPPVGGTGVSTTSSSPLLPWLPPQQSLPLPQSLAGLPSAATSSTASSPGHSGRAATAAASARGHFVIGGLSAGRSQHSSTGSLSGATAAAAAMGHTRPSLTSLGSTVPGGRNVFLDNGSDLGDLAPVTISAVNRHVGATVRMSPGSPIPWMVARTESPGSSRRSVFTESLEDLNG